MTQPPWLDIAYDEIGVTEIPGPRHEDRILTYHDATTLDASSDEIAWCSSFVNWCIKGAGLEPTRSAAARSWAKWGRDVSDDPPVGSIIVFWRGRRDGWRGHVGFFVGWDAHGNPRVLGGNQSNEVNIATYPKDRILAIRWPEAEPVLDEPAPDDIDERKAVRDVQRALAAHFPDILVDGIPGPQTRGYLKAIGV